MKRFLLQYAVGYLIAVLCAVLVTEVLIFGPTVFPDGGRFGSFYSVLSDVSQAIWSGAFLTAITAFPGYLVTVLIVNRFKRHSPYFYCFCGILTALSAHVILLGFIGQFYSESIRIILCSAPGGAAGAFAYYRWRRKILSA